MNTKSNFKLARFKGIVVSISLILFALFLLPASTLAYTVGWIRCMAVNNDICYLYGNVGIGTTTPAANLDVDGNVRFADTLTLGGSSADLIVSDSSVHDLKRIVLSNDDIVGVNSLVIDDPGANEGIIWNYSAAKIFVSPLDGAGNTDGYLRLINDGGIVFEPGAQNAEVMTLNADGRVGVGTTAPNSKFEVSDGYIELDTHDGMPPQADCDSADEVGRMKVDSARPYLYVCMAGGWARK